MLGNRRFELLAKELPQAINIAGLGPEPATHLNRLAGTSNHTTIWIEHRDLVASHLKLKARGPDD